MRDDAVWSAARADLEPIFEPHCAFVWISGLGGTERIGLDGFREGWLDVFEAWESVRTDFDQVSPVGDKVLVLARQYGRMAGTLREVELIGTRSTTCGTAGSPAPSSMRTARKP
jgi:hypothetical protein